MGRRTVTCLIFAAVCTAQQLSDFAGVWVMKTRGQAVMKLTLTKRGDSLTGSMTQPEKLEVSADGEVTAMGGKEATSQFKKIELGKGQLILSGEDAPLTMTLKDANHATMGPFGIPAFKLERVPAGETVVLATSLPVQTYPPEIERLRAQLKAMVKEEQDARLAFDGARMKATDDKNRPEVLRIFEKYGWPKSSAVGSDAAFDFWLLVQHQTPEIQRRLLPEMEKAANAGETSMSNYAYLYDRVQVGLGKPQHWGSQTRCENGKPVLSPVDNPAGLDERRKELGMQPMADYLKNEYIVKSCAGK
jgi:hypothetical protein